MRRERIAAGLVALAAWIGLAVQLDASIGLVGSLGGALLATSRYFTVLTNLAAACVFTAIAAGLPRARSPALVGGVTITLLLVGIVHALLLRGLLDLSGAARLADIFLHSVTPVAAPLFWLAFGRSGRLTTRAPFLWMLVPLAYFAYALARGALEGLYAYPFLNVAKLGWPATVLNAVLIGICFLLAGFVMLALDRRGRAT